MNLKECKCGLKYDEVKHAFCPYCGEVNESYDPDKLDAYLVEEEIRKNGVAVTPVHVPIWKTPGTFWTVAAALAIIILIALIAMLPNARYLRASGQDFFIGGWLYFGGAIAIYGGLLLKGYLDNCTFNIKVPNGKSPSNLGTTNGIGSTLLGGFRSYDNSLVFYDFICLIVPLFPVGCYRAVPGETTQSRKTTSTSYRFYGSEKMKGLEILQVYLVTWGWLPFVFGIFGMVISIFE